MINKKTKSELVGRVGNTASRQSEHMCTYVFSKFKREKIRKKIAIRLTAEEKKLRARHTSTLDPFFSKCFLTKLSIKIYKTAN